ncbi:response regulator transcription factor [Caulobacter sp. S45]|uniref:response regulator transcription factor n=1 Tax=Caulobacter sp. S45 TaxID=1641861 RepID=UPI0035302965
MTPETAAYVSDGLGALGQTVEIASDGRAGLLRASDPQFDCLVIDRLLPGFDGLTVVRTLRSTGVRTPIIFLTAVGGVADRVQGLKAGADDYLVKPFELEELAARVEALRRRPPLPESQTLLRAVDIELDRLERTARRAGQALDLTGSEFRLLEVLMLNAGHAVTRSMLLQTAFGLDHANPATIIEPHISRLRAKLERDGLPDPVRTLRGAGYCIDAA